jgi:hypothetical protein
MPASTFAKAWILERFGMAGQKLAATSKIAVPAERILPRIWIGLSSKKGLR